MVTTAGPEKALVGRGAELAVLSSFLDGHSRGPAVLFVDGESGVGKTTLLGVALDRLTAHDVRVLAAHPTPGEAELPFAALADLFDDAAVDDVLAGLAVPQRRAIEIALVRSPGVVNEHSIARGVLELLRRWSTERPLLIAIDDAQWLDRPTAAALAFSFRRLGPAPIRVLVARRTPISNELEPVLGLGEWNDVERVVVGPLSATDLGTLLRERVNRNLARPEVEFLHQRSDGNPMFALELARRGAGAGTTLSSAIAGRLSGLDASVRQACAYAAAALRPTSRLLIAAGVSPEALRAAVDAGVVEPMGERLRMSHPMLGSVAYELLLPDERRAVHRRLAEASEDLVERGHHVSRAAVAPDENAANAVTQAAEAASARGDHAGAAGLILRAAELAPARAQELRAEGASELLLAGDVDAAAALARGLADDLPSGVLRAKVRRLLVVSTDGGRLSYERALVDLEEAIGDANADLAVQAQLRVEMSDLACGLCRLHEAATYARVAVDLAERAGDDATVVAAMARLGFAESMLGLGVTENVKTAFARWDKTIGGEASPRMELACCLLHATRFDEAIKLFADELDAAEEAGVEPVEVVARGHLAEAQLRAGRWADGLANAKLALEHGRQAADPQIIGACECILGLAEALTGNHDAARSLASDGLAAAEAMSDFWWIIGARAVLGFIALAEDDAPRAAKECAPAWALMQERGLGDLSIFPVAHVLGEALVACGRTDDARTVAAAMRTCPVGAQPWCRAMSNRVEALNAALHHDHASARKLIALAVEAHAELAEPFEFARTVHLLGRIERSARNWGAARSAFLEALERFDNLGAARWAEKATADLARLPGRRPADRTELTTREQEISDLVATGLSNKEIAARLFLSVRTVEANLSRVFTKLGVRSRAQLAGRLNRGPN